MVRGDREPSEQSWARGEGQGGGGPYRGVCKGVRGFIGDRGALEGGQGLYRGSRALKGI